ncbi:MAG: sugar phosphate nucleotidyltransferase [Candidatus Omnitrophica bacterium]|nr:sugar phosphate nucleotidyltransferase [Candidatus Omnitrophota bacterium]
MTQKNMQAVILAGGLGTRLKPITHKTPKVMVEISGRPFLLYLLEMLKAKGLNRILLLIGYLGGYVKDYFQGGSRFGLSISYSVDEELLGTGGALKKAESKIYDNKRREMKDNILVDDMNRIIRYDKNDSNGLCGVDAGVLAFKKEVLNLIPSGRKVSFEESVYQDLIKQEQFFAVLTGIKFLDIGSFEMLKKAPEALK